MEKTPHSIVVLDECKAMQLKKAFDYQNPNSNVTQAMHYRRGIDSIFDTMWGKMLRIQSILESGSNPNFESVEDSFKDLINYASFAVSYSRGAMEGQSPDRDIFNRPKPVKVDFQDPSLEVKSPGIEDTITKYRGKSMPDILGAIPEYVPIYAPYDPSYEHVNFTTTFNERYIGNQATGNVYG